MRLVKMFARLLIVGALGMLALAPEPSAATLSCGSSQSECENCCNDTFQECVAAGCIPVGECDYDDGYCEEPGCFGNCI
jgi:hypothetical protein